MNIGEFLQDLKTALPWFLPVLSGVLGACIGSFLNVCIYRIPVGKSVVRPGSQCGCGQPVAWRDNIPIFSWVARRGKARCCGRRFSIRYPMIEALTAVLFAACIILLPPGKALAAMVFVSLSVVGAFIDIDHLELPDAVTIWGMATGLLCSLLFPSLHGRNHEFMLVASFQSGIDALIGALVGSGLVLWILLFAEKVLRKEAMGFGDVTLLGCIGAFTGWQGALFSVFGGAVLGLVANLVLIALSGKRALAGYQESRDPDNHEAKHNQTGLGELRVPFGPALSAAGVIYLLALQPLVDSYLAETAFQIGF